MDQLILTSSDQNLLQTMLLLPLTIVAGLQGKTFTSSPATTLLIAIVSLAIPTGLVYDVFAAEMMILVALVEYAFTLYWLSGSNYIPDLIEAAMLAIQPDALLAAFAKA